MKIFSAAQLRACDAYTIQSEPVSSSGLMERAAAACHDWIVQHFSKDTLFVVLCGMGNNGGDGLALTRMLYRSGYGVKAFLIETGRRFSQDCLYNLKKTEETDPALIRRVAEDTFITDIPENVLLIDAIFGTGLNRPLEGWIQVFVRHIDQLPNRKIAIDSPTGLPSDTIPDAGAAILHVDHTLSFQFYKRSFLHPEGGCYAGAVTLLDIRLSEHFIRATPTQYHLTDVADIAGIYRVRSAFTHKGSYGHAWIIGGSYGMAGAVVLAARAASRAGAGKVTAVVPEVAYPVLQSAVPEALCLTGGERYIASLPEPDASAVLAIGPGLGTDRRTLRALETLLDATTAPMVLDADALNLIAGKKSLMDKIPAESILTPHPKEFERLFGPCPNSMLRLEKARTQAMRYNIHLVLKDHYTVVVAPDGNCFYNQTGTAALATAGSGDVLTGMIAALLAQGYPPLQAARLGVYLHGLAGRMAAGHYSEEAVIAGDIAAFIGAAYRQLPGPA